MVRAEHSSGGPVEGAGAVYLGEPVGFVVALEDGTRLYHAGDTDLFGDMALIGELHRPDVAFLPIGGHYTMGPRAAAKAVAACWASRPWCPSTTAPSRPSPGRPTSCAPSSPTLGLGSVRVLSPEPGEVVSL